MGGMGYGGWGRGRLYTYRYTVTTRMIPALRWAWSDESHFNVSAGSDGESHKTVSTNHNLFEERRARLTRYRWAKAAHAKEPDDIGLLKPTRSSPGTPSSAANLPCAVQDDITESCWSDRCRKMVMPYLSHFLSARSLIYWHDVCILCLVIDWFTGITLCILWLWSMKRVGQNARKRSLAVLRNWQTKYFLFPLFTAIRSKNLNRHTVWFLKCILEHYATVRAYVRFRCSALL